MANNCAPCGKFGPVSDSPVQKVWVVPCEDGLAENFEIVCAPSDGRPLIAILHPGEATEFFEIDGITPYVGATPVSCSTNIEESEACWIVINDAIGGEYSTDDQITQTTFWDTDTLPPTFIATVWFNNSTGTIIPSASILTSDFISCSSSSEIENPPFQLCDYDSITGQIIGRAWWENTYNTDGSIQTEQLVGFKYSIVPFVVERPYVPIGDLLDCNCEEKLDEFCGLRTESELVTFDVQVGELIEITAATIGLSDVTYLIIDWGDNEVDNLVAPNILTASHTYTTPGEYSISFVACNDGTKISRTVNIDTTVIGTVTHSETNSNTYDFVRSTSCNDVVLWTLKYLDAVVTQPESYFNCDKFDNKTNNVVESGCLSSPAAFDFSDVLRCRVDTIIIDGEAIRISLEPGWLIVDFINAVNAVMPDTFGNDGGSIVLMNGKSLANVEVVCIETDFTETFGIGSPGVFGPIPGGATTTYTLDPTGFLNANDYAVARVQDGRTDVFDMGLGPAAVDATGDPDGNVLMVNGSFTPGEFYRQAITGVVAGQQYTFRAFIANGNTPGGAATPPDVTLRIEDANTGDVLATINTGSLNYFQEWREWNVDFIASVADIEIALTNNSGAAGGNDVLIDQITFSRLSSQLLRFSPRGTLIPVEIVKALNADDSIDNLRVWSIDGQTEYENPHPDGLVLTNIPCQLGIDRPPSISNRTLSTNINSMISGDNLVFPASTIHSISIQVITGTLTLNGVSLPMGTIVNYSGDIGKNNLGSTLTLDALGDVIVTTTIYT